ncbi:hypothetical protein AKJ63_01580 [candidate division MSBL1 archaeon SCGC-AAA259D18]|uniref:SIS domain-containing protein n=1 Tax=candidate division MSBL1 archaeon SCGC-AAA259D18 TaxID=1698262 RepID=A0A133UAW5_9EURY|nr:hypothetical protein AKJ63_01580 [candidate division MSBL1 archaeon SCGC-AAA259D18]
MYFFEVAYWVMGMTVTIEEIKEQPMALEAVLEELEDKANQIGSLLSGASSCLFTGCGSSYYLGLIGAHLTNRTKLPSYAVPAGEMIVSPDSLPAVSPDVVIPISRSGESTETLSAVRELKERNPGSQVLSVTCNEDCSLRELSDVLVVSREGVEESTVATKSFSSMLAAIEYLSRLRLDGEAARDNFRGLPEDSRKVLDRFEKLSKEIGRRTDLEKFVFLGTGEHYGLALEAMLCVKEMSLTWSEAYPLLEFRHGPKSIVGENTLVVVFYSRPGGEKFDDLVKEVNSIGGETFVMGREENMEGLESNYRAEIPVRPEYTDLSLYIAPIQQLGYYRAIGLGLDPDEPRNLEQVVKL